ncbi:hypothetical protein TSAR_000004 [Trichomalopsis sarcophagae]|uniref:Uncharacterized protein n=1 Tax=Trichomalopsis sarcophagae TaxID=543379 RepID=A0A232F9L6_9HYME|nr:hypothetical protein TSAR_000004 [Trichomalopsis sarcophagae]
MRKFWPTLTRGWRVMHSHVQLGEIQTTTYNIDVFGGMSTAIRVQWYSKIRDKGSLEYNLRDWRNTHQRSQGSTVRRMGAWAEDRGRAEVGEEEEAVLKTLLHSPYPSRPEQQQPIVALSSRKSTRRPARQGLVHPSSVLPPYWRGFGDAAAVRYPRRQLQPLRRQFSRQLYEWLPLFRSRTKLISH